MPFQYNPELYKLKAEFCKTFADAKRLGIIDLLRSGEKAVSELAEILATPQAVISRHLSVLRSHGVVLTRRQGTSIFYCLTDPKIGEACALVHQILLNQITMSEERAKNLVR